MKNRLKLSNIKFHEDMSEETNAFTAQLFIDGINVAFCKNDGNGGETNIRANYYENDEARTKKERALLQEAIEYAKTVPHDYSFPNSLDSIIDEMVVRAIIISDVKHLFNDGLVYQQKNSIDVQLLDFKHGDNTVKISYMLSTEKGIKQIQKSIDKLKSENCIIYNNNLGPKINL